MANDELNMPIKGVAKLYIAAVVTETGLLSATTNANQFGQKYETASTADSSAQSTRSEDTRTPGVALGR